MIDADKLLHLAVNGPAVVYTADPASMLTTAVTPNIAQVLGYTEHEWLSRPELWAESVHPDDMLALQTLVPQLFATGALGVEYRIRRKDGVWRWMRDETVLHRHVGVPVEIVGFFYDIDDRKRREESLRREAALFEAMFRHHAVVMYLADAKTGRIIDANAAALAFYGWDHPTITSKHMRCLCLSGHDCHHATIEAMGRGESRVAVARHGLANGEERDVEVRITPILVGEREVLFAVITDITARRLAEEALRRSEERFRGLFENAMEGIFQSTADGRLTICNPALARLLGYDSPGDCLENIRDMGRQAYVDYSDRQRFLAQLERDGVVEGFEVQLQRRNGQRLWALSNARAVRDQEGRLAFVDGVLVDITARKRAEAERMVLVAAVEQTTEGVAIAGQDWCLEYANPAFGDIAGVSRDAVLGRKFFDLFVGQPAGLPVRDITQALERGEEWSGPFKGQRSDGQAYQAESVFSPIRNESGRVERFVILVRDTTCQERLEHRLQRVRKLEAIGTLAGGIAHDFNNILTPILLNAEVALDSLGPGHSQAKALEAILTAGGRARHLIRQVLTFSRLGEVRPKRVELVTIVREALKLMRATLPAHVEARVESNAEPLEVLADSSQLIQIFMNLAENGVHAMRESGGILSVSFSKVRVDAHGLLNGPILAEGDYACLGVRDTGHGIAAPVQERIFTPFFTTKKPGEGTGMGLSTVHGIVRAMGGGVRVESGLGRGSCFEVLLPLADSPQNRPVPGADGERFSGQALLVDDELFTQRGMGAQLREMGFQVTAMGSPAKALRAVERAAAPFAVILAGEELVDSDGRKFLATCRARCPGAALVLLAGKAVDAGGEGAADVVLVKPATPAALVAVLRRAMGKSTARQQRLRT